MADSNTTNGIPYDPTWASRGITQDIWNSLNATQQATIGATLEAASTIVSTTGATVSMSDALTAAASDPSIVSKYTDALNLDKEAFTQQLAQLQIATSVNAVNQKNQFESDQQNLNKSIGSAGMAYSSYADEARKTLNDTESGIVTSTKAQLQSNLDQMTSAFESKYGTTALNSAFGMGSANPDTATYINPLTGQPQTQTGSVAGNNAPGTTNTKAIIGSNVPAEQSDIANLAASTYSTGQQSQTVSPSVSKTS